MKTAVVICPGRGTYNKSELGYLQRHFPNSSILARFDEQRRIAGQLTLTELDGTERFSMGVHTRGDNASALIFAATLGDYLSIDQAQVEIVAVTGNSMGWYSALACSGALSPDDGFCVANTMGTLMQQSLVGGQLVYPHMDNNWQPDPERRMALLRLVADIAARADHALYLSIDLGGMLVLAGNNAGLAAFESAVPSINARYPMRLGNHAAFHTPMVAHVADEGRSLISPDLMRQPTLPLIDGQGTIWWPEAVDLKLLYNYTLNIQVVESYNFSRCIEVAAHEFSPDLFIITGPGNTLGGAVAQSLILADWKGMKTKAAFQSAQAESPLLLSMGDPVYRQMVT